MPLQPIDKRLFKYAVKIGRFANRLPSNQLGNHIARQLIRSGTSPSANYAEAGAAESDKDFIHKLSICLKELRESKLWLDLIIESGILPKQKVSALLEETDQLIRIMAKSIITSKKRMNANKH